jgi:hypothetical protein
MTLSTMTNYSEVLYSIEIRSLFTLILLAEFNNRYLRKMYTINFYGKRKMMPAINLICK